MYRAARTHTAWQRLPLAAGTQHIEDGCHHLAAILAWSARTIRSLRLRDRDQRLNPGPEFIRDAEGSRSLLCVHAWIIPHLMYCRIGSALPH
jgi:hypothetical protein